MTRRTRVPTQRRAGGEWSGEPPPERGCAAGSVPVERSDSPVCVFGGGGHGSTGPAAGSVPLGPRPQGAQAPLESPGSRASVLAGPQPPAAPPHPLPGPGTQRGPRRPGPGAGTRDGSERRSPITAAEHESTS